MMENYSLSDIATATGGGMFGGNNEFIWIFALLILFGGGGFGGFGKGSSGADSEILSNQRADNLSRQINQIGDGISSLGYSQLQQMDANTASINGNITAEGRAIQSQLCAINSNIDNKFAALEKSQLEQRIAEQAQQISQLQTSQMLCGIPKVNNTAWGVYPYNQIGCNNI